ncbi:MAG: hypothetical protein U0271_33195 [Polyangiaceae bacterium]
MRRRRFRWHWPKTWLILQSVNTGMFVGVPFQYFGRERGAVLAAVVVAFVLILRGWVRLDARTPHWVHANAEDDAAVRAALALDPRSAQASALRFLFPFAAPVVLVVVTILWVLLARSTSIGPLLSSIPTWVLEWVGADLGIAGLAVIANAYYAFERLDTLVGVHVDANKVDDWSSQTKRILELDLPKPTLIGDGYIVVGAYDLSSRAHVSALETLRGVLANVEHRVIAWPGAFYDKRKAKA